jgi:hypothetical protein
MATYDNAYLLSAFNRVSGRPSTGLDTILDTTKYQWLSEAQNEIVAAMAATVPWVLYPSVAYASLPTMSTSDNQVWTFGTDSDGYAIEPMGKVSIYRNLNDIPDNPMIPGVDFLREGTAIRIPNNQTYFGTLIWRGITPPPDITASQQPSLFPEASRAMIWTLAIKNFGESGNRNPDLANRMAIRIGYPWTGDVGEFARWCTTWRTQYRGGGALGSISGRRLAIGAQFQTSSST